MRWHSRPRVHVFSNALEPCGLMKESSANAFPYDIPVGAARDHFHFLLLHNFLELGTNLADLSHGLHVDKMVLTPLTRVALDLPLLVDVQVCQVVGFRYLGN